MTIQERNREIATMLGGMYVRDENLSFEPKGRWCIKQFPDANQDYDLKFHSDWNWLNKAVEFVEKTNRPNDKEYYPYLVTIWKNCCHISDGNNGYKVIEIYAASKTEAVFTAVSDFAKLFNKDKL